MDRLRTPHFPLVFRCIIVVFIVETMAVDVMDTMWPLIFTGEEDGLFGFSVAFHQDGNQHMLLVGAPHTDNEGEIDREGAFYRCDINNLAYTEPCDQIQLDNNIGQPRSAGGSQSGSKSNSFLGATVRSGGPDGPVLVCAPSFVWYFKDKRNYWSHEPTGRCFIAKNNFTIITKYQPCLRPKGDKNTWHCQAGVGGDISMDQVLLGGPGSFYGLGQIFRRGVDYPKSEKHTWEAPPRFDDSYRGYTVLLGDLNDDGILDNVAGTPRGNNMFGLVSVFAHDLVSLYNHSGTQLGEFFGNSLAVTDLNNDGMNDLIVGAPMYSHQEQILTKFEIGRIYIFLKKKTRQLAKLQLEKTIIGRNGRGRFGFSLAAMGDINNDGYNDLAVGAPYDGDGAVFIFSGGPRGIKTAPLQIVRPSDLRIEGRPLTGFGFSLSGQQDVDNNTYPDLGIGSHSSSSAVILRTRPVVKVKATITFDIESINLEEPNFNLSSNVMVPGFNITTCVSYAGSGINDTLPFSFELKLDSGKTVLHRAFILHDGRSLSKHTWEDNLHKGVQDCVQYNAYAKKLIRDKLTPVLFKFSYHFHEDMALTAGNLLPIFPEISSITEQLAILKNCSNAQCLPDLGIDITHDLFELSVGKSEMLIVDVDFQNNGDEAFEARLHVQTPTGVTFVQVESLSSDAFIECEELFHPSGNSNLTCDVGNPVPAEHEVPFRLHFEINLDDKVNNYLEIYFLANSSNIDVNDTFSDNTKIISIPVSVSYKLDFSGYSNPGQSVYNTNFTLLQNVTREQDVGEEIIHFYIFRNEGPNDVGESTLTLQWPMYTIEGDYVLYLTSVSPSVGECQVPDGELNPHKLVLINDNNINNETVVEIVRNYRAKREADEDDDHENKPTPQPLVMIDCITGKCVNITCQFGKLGGNSQPIVLSIRSRLWLQTLKQTVDKATQPSDWVISSTATVTVTGSVYTLDNPLPDPLTSTATTRALPAAIYVNTALPLWAFIVAAPIGFIVLTCIMSIAWKLGFFKRMKLEDNLTKQNMDIDEDEDF